MGRQVNFWMLEQDAREFAQFVLSEPNVVIISDRETPDPYLRVVTELPSPPERWWWSVHFWNRDFHFEPSWVLVREGPARGLYAFAPEEQDPIIEFTRSILRESGELSEGRIWSGCRDEAFLRWYDHVANWIRRRYEKVRKVGNNWMYAGPQAYEWHQAGGVLGR